MTFMPTIMAQVFDHGTPGPSAPVSRILDNPWSFAGAGRMISVTPPPPLGDRMDSLLVPLAGGLGCLLLILLLVWALTAYNRLVRQRNQVNASWAQIDVQLKRRHDLIPNLVETVKAYAGHERATLEAVVSARNGALHAAQGGVAGRADAEDLLGQALGRLFALSEAYPSLRANQNFAALQRELSETEDKIAYARQFYNSAVQTLTNTIQSFPSSLVAGLAGFRAPDYFAAAGAERGPVQVQL
jgi:LemA protein